MFDPWTLAWATVPSSQSIGAPRNRRLTQIFRWCAAGNCPPILPPGFRLIPALGAASEPLEDSDQIRRAGGRFLAKRRSNLTQSRKAAKKNAQEIVEVISIRPGRMLQTVHVFLHYFCGLAASREMARYSSPGNHQRPLQRSPQGPRAGLRSTPCGCDRSPPSKNARRTQRVMHWYQRVTDVSTNRARGLPRSIERLRGACPST
jgi:hypothetical protein